MATHGVRGLVAVVAVVLGLAACGDSDDTDSSDTTAAAETTAPAETTAAPETTAPAETTAAPETTAPAETTAAPETTAPAESTAAPETTGKPTLAITSVDFEAGTVTITNTGEEAVSTDGMVMCQFPNYNGIGSETVEPGASMQVDASIVGGASAVAGEIALYVDGSFTSADSIISYVEWGAPDHERAPVAVEAGIWDGQAVDVTDATSISTDGAAATAAAWSAAGV